MGGSVAFNALVARPGVFDAAIVYASTSTNALDNFTRWQRDDDRLRRAVFREHGSPSDNPGFWRGISAVAYVDRITEPVLGPLRRAVPPVRLGAMAMDLSPIIVVFGISILSNWLD